VVRDKDLVSKRRFYKSRKPIKW